MRTKLGADRRIAPGEAGSASSTRVQVVDEVDDYMAVVAGVQIESIRTGRGVGPNRILTTRGDGFVATGVSTGFPLLGRTTLGDDEIALMAVRSAPPGARFCDVDLRPGTVVCYGPAAEHTGVNPVGFEFAFIITTGRELAARAEVLGRRFTSPPRGQVYELPATRPVRAFGETLLSLETAAGAGVDPRDNREDDLMLNAVQALGGTPHRRVSKTRKRIDDRRLASRCVEYADAMGRLPSIGELCAVAHVSERRLRLAFVRAYGMPPTHFFRLWGLDRARRSLLAAESHGRTVTEIARGLGFAHLGRFAGRYRALYGESPAETRAIQTSR